MQSAVTEKTIEDWGFTKNTGTVTGVKINGITNSPSRDGVVDLGNMSGGGGGSIDMEVLEAYVPMSRDFSDDFNDSFAR